MPGLAGPVGFPGLRGAPGADGLAGEMGPKGNQVGNKNEIFFLLI